VSTLDGIKVKRAQTSVRLKDSPLGEVTAVVATLNVRDHDGDVATRETFIDGEELIISSYNHSSMIGAGALPVGKGTLRVDANQVVVEANYFLMNQTAREAFEVVQQMGPSQEWSFGYRVEDAELGTFRGERVNFLKRVHVFEASPVVKGAGIGTRTLSAKEELQAQAIKQFLTFVRGQLPANSREAEARAQLVQQRAQYERSRYLSRLAES
jgi:hypothetical protein